MLILLDYGQFNVKDISDLTFTILVEPAIKWLLDVVDCRLMMESLIEDSLMEEEDMQSFRAVGDKNHRQANFSTSVILTRGSEEGEYSDRNKRKKQPRRCWFSNPPVLVVYDGVDERIVDGGSLCYDGWDGLGVWRQDVGVSTDRKEERIRISHEVAVSF